MTKKVISSDYKERMSDPELTWYEKIYGESEHDVKTRLLRVMKEEGVHRVQAAYSGGHDEGGVQSLRAWNAAGEERGPSSYDEPLWQVCDEVLTTKFFSWALGFTVEGILYVDLGEKRCWTEGQMETWAQDEDPLDWKL